MEKRKTNSKNIVDSLSKLNELFEPLPSYTEVRDEGWITIKEAGASLNMHKDTAKKKLEALVEQGLFERRAVRGVKGQHQTVYRAKPE